MSVKHRSRVVLSPGLRGRHRSGFGALRVVFWGVTVGSAGVVTEARGPGRQGKLPQSSRTICIQPAQSRIISDGGPTATNHIDQQSRMTGQIGRGTCYQDYCPNGVHTLSFLIQCMQNVTHSSLQRFLQVLILVHDLCLFSRKLFTQLFISSISPSRLRKYYVFDLRNTFVVSVVD